MKYNTDTKETVTSTIAWDDGRSSVIISFSDKWKELEEVSMLSLHSDTGLNAC